MAATKSPASSWSTTSARRACRAAEARRHGTGDGRVRIVIQPDKPPQSGKPCASDDREETVSVLRATHLAKSYKKRQVISDLSVEVESGQIVGLLGPNGAGKTTAFYMIVGLVPPDAGTVTIDDRDITHLAMHQRAHAGIGYLPQEASVFRKLTVEDNVMAILETRATSTKPRARSGSSRSWANCASRTCARASAWRCRAANAGASKSRARWPPSPVLCSSMNHLRASTRSRSSTSSES